MKDLQRWSLEVHTSSAQALGTNRKLYGHLFFGKLIIYSLSSSKTTVSTYLEKHNFPTPPTIHLSSTNSVAIAPTECTPTTTNTPIPTADGGNYHGGGEGQECNGDKRTTVMLNASAALQPLFKNWDGRRINTEQPGIISSQDTTLKSPSVDSQSILAPSSSFPSTSSSGFQVWCFLTTYHQLTCLL